VGNQVKAFVFDVGETLIDETRIWLRWAQRLGVSGSTLMGLIGAQAASDKPLLGAFEAVQPGFDLAAAEAAWRAEEPSSLHSGFTGEDLYPDVIPALTRLKSQGYYLLVAGNQPPAALAALHALNLPVDVIANSAELGVEKPSLAFFEAVLALAAGLDPALDEPGRVAYVGDRLDNDVNPAAAAGFVPILIRRGPWGYLHAQRPAAAETAVIDSLLELPLS